MIRKWVAQSASVFGDTFPVYNVHMIGHLFEDYLRHGNLLKISAFKFENAIGTIKRLVKNNINPLRTVQKRKIKPQL